MTCLTGEQLSEVSRSGGLSGLFVTVVDPSSVLLPGNEEEEEEGTEEEEPGLAALLRLLFTPAGNQKQNGYITITLGH